MATIRTPAGMVTSIHAIEEAEQLDAAVERLEPVAGKLAAGRTGEVLRGEWLGHALHPLLTDFPLGCWASAGLLDLVGGRRSRDASQRLVGLGLAFVPATAAAGWVDWSATADRRSKRVGVVHAVGNTVVAALYWCSWRSRRRGRHVRGVAFGMAGGLLAWVTGYLGGHLSFGRGTGIGPRGFDDEEGTSGVNVDGSEEHWVGVAAAAEMLGVNEAQVLALVDADMLVPRRGSGDTSEFLRTDVLAARLAGA